MVAPAVTARTVSPVALRQVKRSYAFQAVSELCSAGYVEISAATRRVHRMRVVPSIPDQMVGSQALGPVTRPVRRERWLRLFVVRRPRLLSERADPLRMRRGAVCGATGVCEAPATEEPSQGDGWTCNPSYYNANDGCDCDCGIRTQTANAPISASTTVKRGRPAMMPVNASNLAM